MEMNNFTDLLIEQIKDLYSAETQLVKALPKMEKYATATDLKAAFHRHLEETQIHVRRLEEICRMLDCDPKGEKCYGIQGLIKESEHMIKNTNGGSPDVKDAGLIAAAQRVEHYEISGYGTARSFAQRLGEDEVAELLQETLEEESQTDKKLTQICEALHPMAA